MTVTVRVKTAVTGAVVAGLIVGAFLLGRRTAEPDWESIAAKIREFRRQDTEGEAPS